MEYKTIIDGGAIYTPVITQKQIIYLDFDGEITSYNGEILTVDGVEVQNSNLTAERIAAIVDQLNADYANKNVVFVTEKPLSGEYSTVYVGKTDAFDSFGTFTGLAETIDSGNRNKSDNAFVMLDSSSNNEKIIETISHETDHLLGTLDHGGTGLNAYGNYYGISGYTASDYYLWYDSMSISNGTVNYVSGYSSYINIYNGGKLNYAAVSNGFSINVSSGGVANSTTVNEWGDLYVESGGVANNVTVNNYGYVYAYSGAVISGLNHYSSAYVYIESGATLYDATMHYGANGYGNIYVSSGGYAENIRISSGGDFHVYGSAVNVIVSGNKANGDMSDLFISAGGYASNVEVYSGAQVDFLSSGYGLVEKVDIYSGGIIKVSRGYSANDVTVHSGGSASVYYGNINNATIQSGGYVRAYEGALNHITLDSGASMFASWGYASNVLVNYGASAYFYYNNATIAYNPWTGYISAYGTTPTYLERNAGVYIGGYTSGLVSSANVVSNLTLTSGNSAIVYEDGKLTGSMNVASGAVISAQNGAEINFDLTARKATDGALLNDYAKIEGTPDYTITVSATQADGVYKLAGGASSFDSTVTIVTPTTQYTSVSVGSFLIADDIKRQFEVVLKDGVLSLEVSSDFEAPTLTITGNSASWVKGNITLSASAVDAGSGVASFQYSLDSGITWETYTKALVVDFNGAVLFRAEDNAGNSVEKKVIVSKVDNKAPVITLTKGAVDWQNQQLWVAAMVTDQYSGLKSIQYTLNNGTTWQDYTPGTTVFLNSDQSIFFRAEDNVGNTTVDGFTLSNINNNAPLIFISGNYADWTRDKTVISASAADYADKIQSFQYSLNSGKTWQTYIGPVTMSANG